MINFSQLIITIGRNKFYPYICLLIVTASFIYTDPFSSLNWRYTMSYLGAFCGLLCVILLAKRKNSGNVIGMFAVIFEGIANFLGNNLGASLPAIYNFGSHIYGLLTWRKHQDQDSHVKVRILSEKAFLLTLLFLIAAIYLNIYLTNSIGIFNTDYQLISNCLIFGLAVVAQLLLMTRFSFNWYLWTILNVLVIFLNIYTNNPIIATQYLVYLFNSIYGICEWNLSIKQNKSMTTIIDKPASYKD